MEHIQVEIPKLYGDHHTAVIQQALGQVSGVMQVWISPARRQVKVAYNPQQVDAETIIQRLARAGYQPRNGSDVQAGRGKDPAWAGLDLRLTQTYPDS